MSEKPAPRLHETASDQEPDELTETLRQVFASVLDLPPLKADDDFFDCGGHSLQVVRLISRIHQSLGISLRPVDFIDHATPRRLASRIRQS
ncbi:acyl carrier protein [Streptomyces sp. V4I23]|uniref:acyl carrier protein n=1 Tax=Streptomyces sp. V4I23 TaxID=3042282 RepID=UPI00278A8AC7|nr:acyl carrier protein [Streptomyces sp. V4I23]MDQ1005772.1 acyl carrier protein [Streptomyces sp. V4I23]